MPALLIRPLLAAALLACAPAYAERADRDQPMNAEADSLRYDEARQTSVFSGHVVITKGSILIRGEQVEVRQDPQGHQFGLVLAGPDRPASFRQKRDGVDETIEGEARRIEYDGRADTIRLTGQAVLRRYRGATLGDETAGGVIVYNNQSATFSVDGGPASASAGNPSGRVRATLSPKPRADAQPARPLPLQATPTLGARP